MEVSGENMNKRQKKKKLKRELGRVLISVDYSNGKDMTAECKYRYIDGVVRVFDMKCY